MQWKKSLFGKQTLRTILSLFKSNASRKASTEAHNLVFSARRQSTTTLYASLEASALAWSFSSVQPRWDYIDLLFQ